MSSNTSNEEWLSMGDRSDPTLKLIDEEIKPSLTYDGHEADVKGLEDTFFEDGDASYMFGEMLFRIIERQSTHEGHRSHPRLVKLDALKDTLTYDGWEGDFGKAEREHLQNRSDYSFDTAFDSITRKQAMHDGDRSHEELVLLDSLNVSYPGWEAEMEEEIEAHRSGLMCISRATYTFAERQRVYDGDRSHPRLCLLDATALDLTYLGHEEEVANVEELHMTEFWLKDDVCDEFRALLRNLTRKQSEVEGTPVDMSSYPPIQRQIVETPWTYPGWEEDVENVHTISNVCLYGGYLEKSQLRQMIHDNNYSQHSALITLNELRLAYPGWEEDVDKTKEMLRNEGYSICKGDFKEKIQGMKNKQMVFKGHLQLNQKRSAEKGDFGHCKICWEAPNTHIFVPCGHMCVCLQCSHRVMSRNRKCPVCKQSVTLAMEVFLP